MRKILSIVASLFAIFVASSARAEEFADLAARCAPDVHVRTLSALVRQESGGNPFTINVNRAGTLKHQPARGAEAVLTARRLLAEGRNIDIGLAQINSSNFADRDIETLFTPCGNLQAAARILAECYGRAAAIFGEGQSALLAALSCYNTGSFTAGMTNGYVRKVSAKARLPVPELLPAGSNPSTPSVRHAPPPKAGGEPDVFAASGDADAFDGETTRARYNDQK